MVAVGLAQVGDGTRLGNGDRAAWVLLFKALHGGGQHAGELLRGFLHVDGVEGEAALLVKKADISCGLGGGIRAGLLDEADAEFVAVRDEALMRAETGMDRGDGFVRSNSDDGLGLGKGSLIQTRAESEQRLELRGEFTGKFFHLRQAAGGELDDVLCTKQQTTQDALKGGRAE